MLEIVRAKQIKKGNDKIRLKKYIKNTEEDFSNEINSKTKRARREYYVHILL